MNLEERGNRCDYLSKILELMAYEGNHRPDEQRQEPLIKVFKKTKI